MADARDIATVDEAAWKEAVARANVLRRLAGQERLSRAVVLEACRELGIRRARLYQLLRVYRTRPVTSSLINGAPGSRARRASPVRRRRGADRRGDLKLLRDVAKAERHRLTLTPVDYAAAALAAGDEEGRQRLRAALKAWPAELRRRVHARFRALAAEKVSARARLAEPKDVARRPVSRTPARVSPPPLRLVSGTLTRNLTNPAPNRGPRL